MSEQQSKIEYETKDTVFEGLKNSKLQSLKDEEERALETSTAPTALFDIEREFIDTCFPSLEPAGYALKIFEFANKFDNSVVYKDNDPVESPHEIDQRIADRNMFVVSASRSTARAIYGDEYAKLVQEELRKIRDSSR